MMELPLFPLSGVLLPYGRLPLQIFEPRYLDLVKDSMKSESPFGVVWIRRGAEVAERGRASAELGDYGTCAHIVDWDQLDNGLLGITIEGGECFDLFETSTRSDGLVIGQVEIQPTPPAVRLSEDSQSLLDILRSLEQHPHVQRLNLRLDYNDSWQVVYALVQLLPMDEALKYELLGMADINDLAAELQVLLKQISGEN